LNPPPASKKLQQVHERQFGAAVRQLVLPSNTATKSRPASGSPRSPKSSTSLYARRRQQMELKATAQALTLNTGDSCCGLSLMPLSTSSSSASGLSSNNSSCSGLSSRSSPNLGLSSLASSLASPNIGPRFPDACFEEEAGLKNCRPLQRPSSLAFLKSSSLEERAKSPPIEVPGTPKWWETKLVKHTPGTLGVVYSPVSGLGSKLTPPRPPPKGFGLCLAPPSNVSEGSNTKARIWGIDATCVS